MSKGPTITAKIDVKKIDEKYLFTGAKGTYLDFVLWDGADDYGNDGKITQSIPKEAREAGEKGAIIGSFKYRQPKEQPQQQRRTSEKPASQPKNDGLSDQAIPF